MQTLSAEVRTVQRLVRTGAPAGGAAPPKQASLTALSRRPPPPLPLPSPPPAGKLTDEHQDVYATIANATATFPRYNEARTHARMHARRAACVETLPYPTCSPCLRRCCSRSTRW